MRGFVFSSIFLFFYVSIFAQNSNLSSTIIQSGLGSPVENVIVEIPGTGLATKTRSDGGFYFSQSIPEGEHVLSISKEGYDVGFFLVKVVSGKPIVISNDKGEKFTNKIEIKVNKYAAERRSRAEKAAAKEEQKRLKEAKKSKANKDKLIAKNLKKLKKKQAKTKPIVTKKEFAEESEITFSEAQYKYAKVLGVSAEELSNQELYDFIAEWEGVPYLMGGEGKRGIDCSAFTQRLFAEVYNLLIERTADRQFNSKESKTFRAVESANEGDLVFFSVIENTISDKIDHVGIYLKNNKFVSATSTGGRARGVKITDLTDPYWKKRFVAFARRVSNN